jgi:hypothetical protein
MAPTPGTTVRRKKKVQEFMALGVADTRNDTVLARRFTILPVTALVAAGLLLAACAKPASQASAGNGDGLDGIAPAAGNGEAAAAPAPDSSPPGPPGSGIAGGEPYVVIRFPDSSVDYQSSLAEAVRRAKERKPNLAFDLVALTPPAQSADDLADAAKEAQDRAQGVVKSLGGMGIPADHVNIVTWTGQSTDVDEIRLYIR